MVTTKVHDQELLGEKFVKMFETPNPSGSEAGSIYGKEASDILAYDIVERRVARIYTWPFDTGILGRFAAVLLSVFAAIISRLLILALLGI